MFETDKVVHLLAPSGHIQVYPLKYASVHGIMIPLEDPYSGGTTFKVSPHASRKGYVMYKTTCKDVETEDGDVINEYEIYEEWLRQIKGMNDPPAFPLELHSEEARTRRKQGGVRSRHVNLPKVKSGLQTMKTAVEGPGVATPTKSRKSKGGKPKDECDD